MIRKRLGRIATILSTAMLATMLVGVGSASAAQPDWWVTFDNLPNVVSPGSDAGWLVTVGNEGPSNINDLNIKITAPDNEGMSPAFTLPSYLDEWVLSSGGTADCSNATGVAVCNVGTLVAGGTASFVVAFQVPATQNGSFDINIALIAGTGDTGSDKPGKSRGDDDNFPWVTPVSNSSNFDGGFTVDDFIYQTNQDVGRRNVQATTIENVGDNIGVTIEDGITTGVDCQVSASATCFGEWSALNVDDGAQFGTPFKVTLLISGSSVPGGTATGDVVLVHVRDNGSVDVIGDTADERCASAEDSASAECIYVTKVGSTYKIVAWLLQNGNLRGGF